MDVSAEWRHVLAASDVRLVTERVHAFTLRRRTCSIAVPSRTRVDNRLQVQNASELRELLKLLGLVWTVDPSVLTTLLMERSRSKGKEVDRMLKCAPWGDSPHFRVKVDTEQVNFLRQWFEASPSRTANVDVQRKLRAALSMADTATRVPYTLCVSSDSGSTAAVVQFVTTLGTLLNDEGQTISTHKRGLELTCDSIELNLEGVLLTSAVVNAVIGLIQRRVHFTTIHLDFIDAEPFASTKASQRRRRLEASCSSDELARLFEAFVDASVDKLVLSWVTRETLAAFCSGLSVDTRIKKVSVLMACFPTKPHESMMLSQWFAATLLNIKVRTTHFESIGIDMSWKPCDIAMLQLLRQQSDNNCGFPALLFSDDTLSRLEIMDEMSTEQVLKQLKVLAPSNVSGKTVRVLRRTPIHFGPREDPVVGASVAFPEDRVLRAVDMVDGWVSVVVPFHGIGWLAADHVEFVDGTPGLRLHPTLPLRLIRTVKMTELGANQEQLGEVLMTLGTGLQHLVLTLSSDTNLTWTTLTTIWSARLTHLRLVNASLKSFDDIVELYRLHPISSIAVLELIEPCVDDTESIIRFAQRLRDPRHPMTKRLRELRLRHTVVYRGGKTRQLTRRHLKEFQDMLKVNKTLRHLDLEVNLRLLSEFQSEFLEYHDEQLPVSPEVIAFFSVVAADNTPVAGVLRRVETGVLRHILTFTLESRRRSVCLRKLGEKI